jgi:hypothetical protein
MDDRDPRNGIWGSACHEEGDNDILGMLSKPFKMRIRQWVCNSFIVHVRNSYYPFKAPRSSPHPNVPPPLPASSTAIYPAPITVILFGCSSRSKKPSESMPSHAPRISVSEGISLIYSARSSNAIIGRAGREGTGGLTWRVG